MKITFFGSIAILLLATSPSLAQKITRDELRILEEQAVSIKDKALVPPKSDFQNPYDLFAEQVFLSFNSVSDYVLDKRKDKSVTFEASVVPYLESKCAELNLQLLDFNEEEDQLFESFIKCFDWNKTVELVNLYEDFIFKNKNQLSGDALLVFFSFTKRLHNFLLIEKQECLIKNLNYNTVEWQIFAINPGRLLFWTVAACAWDDDLEK